MHTEKPDTTPAQAALLAAHRTDQKQDRQAEPLAPEGVLRHGGGKLDRATAGVSPQGTTERLVKLLDPDNIGRSLAKQGVVDLTSGMNSKLKEGRATQPQPGALTDTKQNENAASASAPAPGSQANAQPAALAGTTPRHGSQQTETPRTDIPANKTPAPTNTKQNPASASAPADTAQANAQPATLAGTTPSHNAQQTETPRADIPAHNTPAPTNTNRNLASAPTPAAKPTGSIATAPIDTTPPTSPAHTSPSAESSSPAPVASAETRMTESTTPGQQPHERHTTSTPSGTQQAGGPSLAELLETLDKEWRQDVAASANTSAGPNTQPGAQPEVVRQYADSITALLQSPSSPFTANNGHPAAIAENARREAFDREVTERLKRLLAAGPNAASRLSQADITAIHAEALRRQLVDNGVLAPNEDLPDASQLA